MRSARVLIVVLVIFNGLLLGLWRQGELKPRAAVSGQGTATAIVAGPEVASEPTLPTPALAFAYGSPASRAVALTFDADMTPYMLAELHAHIVNSWFNQQVVDILDRERVPATMFLTGLWVETYPDVARRLATDPLFEIGNHTYDHAAFRTPCFGLAPVTDRRQEIVHAQQVIAAKAGVQPRLFRFPGDCFDASDVALARNLGLTVVSGKPGWDAFNKDPASIVAHEMAQVRPGAILILHLQGGNTAPSTGLALGQIIDSVRRRGLHFVTVSTLLNDERDPVGSTVFP